MTFRVGQKVVCVDAGDHPSWPAAYVWKNDAPVVGEIYTVARCLAGDGGGAVLHLAEIQRSAGARREWGNDVGYGAWRFRPVVERKTDISVFTEILRKATKPARTPAMSQQERGTEQ